MMTFKDAPIPNYIRETNPLSAMFKLRVELNEQYSKKRGLMGAPLTDLVSRDNQEHLRNIIGFLEEEIIELFSEIIKLSQEDSNPSTADKSQIIKTFTDLSEEVSDVNHFFLSLFTYLNVDLEDIYTYYERLLDEKGLSVLISDNVLEMALAYGNHINAQDGFFDPAFKRQSKNFSFIPHDWYTAARNNISEFLLPNHEARIFRCIYNLNKMKTQLKNKMWRETEQTPSIEFIHGFMMEAWINWSTYLSYLGLTPNDIYVLYNKKHFKNLDRLENGW